MGGLVLVILRRPAAALGGVLCTYGLEQWAQANSDFFLTHVTITNYVTGGVLVLALTLGVMRGKRALAFYPLAGWLSVGLLLWSLVSVLWSVYPVGTREVWGSSWPYVVTVIVLSPLLIVHPSDLKDGLVATLALGSAVLLLMTFSVQWTGRSIILGEGSSEGAFVAATGNPLAAASLAGYVVLTALLMNFQGMWRPWNWLRWVIIAIGAVVSIRSGSRGQLFAMLLAAMVFLPISRRFVSAKGFFASVAGLLLLAGLTVWAHSQFAQESRWQWEGMVETYHGTRLSLSWELLAYWWNSSPFYWLVGLGNSASYSPSILGFYPHLVLAEVLAEEGLVGLILLGGVVVSAGRSVISLRRYTASSPEARGVLAAMGAMFAFEFILSFKQGSMLGSTYLFAFAIMLGRFEQVILRQYGPLAGPVQRPGGVMVAR